MLERVGSTLDGVFRISMLTNIDYFAVQVRDAVNRSPRCDVPFEVRRCIQSGDSMAEESAYRNPPVVPVRRVNTSLHSIQSHTCVVCISLQGLVFRVFRSVFVPEVGDKKYLGPAELSTTFRNPDFSLARTRRRHDGAMKFES